MILMGLSTAGVGLGWVQCMWEGGRALLSCTGECDKLMLISVNFAMYKGKSLGGSFCGLGHEGCFIHAVQIMGGVGELKEKVCAINLFAGCGQM